MPAAGRHGQPGSAKVQEFIDSSHRAGDRNEQDLHRRARRRTEEDEISETEHGVPAVELMHTLKRADPLNIMNPGKVVQSDPTLLCQTSARTGGRTIEGPDEMLTILETIMPWQAGLTSGVGASQLSFDLGLAVMLDAPYPANERYHDEGLECFALGCGNCLRG